MRVNVYAEELTIETQCITKHVDDPEYGPRTFYGIRLYLESPDVLHDTPDDDDRSAITFWVPWTREGGHDWGLVVRAFDRLVMELSEAQLKAKG